MDNWLQNAEDERPTASHLLKASTCRLPKTMSYPVAGSLP
jgi:hypothetical protein